MNEHAHPLREYVCRSLFRAAALLALGGRYLRPHRSGVNMTDFVFADADRRICALDWELRNGDPPPLPFKGFADGYYRLRAEHRALHGVVTAKSAPAVVGVAQHA